MLGLTVLSVLWGVASLVAVAVELAGGATGTFELGGRRLPLWVLWVGSAVAAAVVTQDSYANWRRTGPHHGILDIAVEPTGLRIARPGTWGRSREVLVQRGETVILDARLVRDRRAGTDRSYRFTVSAPAGSFGFVQPIYVEKLSLVPLDEAARELRITVEVSGAMTAVERLGVPA
ncbi:hypothetical protein [uncultured Cellulomonas sp.]|uniref:hypothetical protein n=1 Tax=uncultured Cellulomonas sp. TaxID=189682 RepID=UPI00261C9470|nr:hypothetical protein [uncultured Cellulomonas sp.]